MTRLEARRRKFWRESMEDGYRFMMDILDYPVAECGRPLVLLREIARKAGVEVSFSRRRRMRAGPALFLLREDLGPSFLSVAEALNRRGLVLKVEDAYRTRAMQNPLLRGEPIFERIVDLATWENGGVMPDADTIFRRLTALVATIPKIGTHMSGSALDISVLERGRGRELDRGGAYLEMSPVTPMNSPFISPGARRNRETINEIMLAGGFRAYPFEFWHYSSGDAYDEYLSGGNRPARYGPVDACLSGGAVSPVENPRQPIVGPAEIAREVKRILAARSAGRGKRRKDA